MALVAPDTDPLLRQCRTLLETLVGVRTHLVTADSATTAATALGSVSTELDALLFPHASWEYAAEAQALTGIPVVTGEDTTAIALAAALTTTLARAGRRPRSGHVVIAGADVLPLLFPLVMLGGIGQVTKWNLTDAPTFPLRRVAAEADAIIDLIAATDLDAGFDAGPAVITPDRERDTLLALPGLVRAVAQTPHARLDIEVHRACVLALVMATPPTDLLPHGPDRELTDRVATAAVTALRATDIPFATD